MSEKIYYSVWNFIYRGRNSVNDIQPSWSVLLVCEDLCVPTILGVYFLQTDSFSIDFESGNLRSNKTLLLVSALVLNTYI